MALAGLLGGIGGLGGKGPFNQILDKVVPDTNSFLNRENNLDLQDLRNKNNLDVQKLKNKNITDNTNKVTQNRLDLQKNQNDFTKAQRDQVIKAFKDAGLPDFAAFGSGLKNLGSTSEGLGNGVRINSFGHRLNLNKTGDSPFADLNGLSRPDYGSLG